MIPGLSPELERILEAGNSAPSGENCQPWRFVVRGSTVDVYLLPERDQSAYSWGQRASYLACGAVVENILIAATAERMRAKCTLLPDPKDAWHVAKITFTPDASVIPDALASAIPSRISNRKPYKSDALSDAERSALSSAGGSNLVLIEQRDAITRLGRIGSTNEEVMLANKGLHNFFFSHVSWTKEEDDKNKIGFYIKTLELPPPAEKMFKLFSNWSVMRILAAIGFNRIVAKQNAATNASAAAMGAILIGSTEPLDFIQAGRAVERVWLAATAAGLSFQPLTGVLFFKLKIAAEKGAFSKRERALISNAYQDAASILGAGERHVAFMFRVGHGDAPSAHAVRFPLSEVIMISS